MRTSTARSTFNSTYATDASDLWQEIVDYHDEVLSVRKAKRLEMASKQDAASKARERKDVARRLKERQAARHTEGESATSSPTLPAPWEAGAPPKKVMQAPSPPHSSPLGLRSDGSVAADDEVRRPLTPAERKAELERLTMQRRQKILLSSARGLKGGPPSKLSPDERRAAMGRLYSTPSISARPRTGLVYGK